MNNYLETLLGYDAVVFLIISAYTHPLLEINLFC